MWPLCVKVILGIETQNSNPIWVLPWEEWFLPMWSFVCVQSYACTCLGPRVTYHPNWLDICMCCKFINSLASLFRFYGHGYNCNPTTSISNCHILVEWNQSKCSFYIGHIQWLHVNNWENLTKCEFLRGLQFKSAIITKILKEKLNMTSLLIPPCWVH